jgi:hypothetical protein
VNLDIPSLDGVPMHVSTNAVPPALCDLARAMARGGLMQPSDLRVGGGGIRRLVEKPIERWWVERGLGKDRRLLPLRFHVVAGIDLEEAVGVKAAWLVLDSTGGWTRSYLERFTHGVGVACPEFAEHVLAVLYAGVDSTCYAVKPPDMLRLARAYWWKGTDDEKRARSLGDREVMSRRRFDNRVPRITQAPAYNLAAFRRMQGFATIKRLTTAVDRWSRDPRILRPNGHRVTGKPPGRFALALRCRYGDPVNRILHDHWHAMGRRTSCSFHCAWKIPEGRAGLARMLERIEATTRLVRAVEDLLLEITWSSTGSFH